MKMIRPFSGRRMEKQLKLIIEALLFAAEKPLLVRDIQGVLPDRDLSEIVEALEALRLEYETMDRSFSLKEVAQGYQIRTKPDYATYVLRMTKRSSARLSPAAMETLAIVAYKQPVIRQEIEHFRGVDTGGILRTLLEKNLIRIMGRKHLPGRPLIYGTTRKFLEVFDLNNLESLPKLKEIKEFGIGEVQATQTHENKTPAAATVQEEEIKTETRSEKPPS
jgi:segregation and condensation protein B